MFACFFGRCLFVSEARDSQNDRQDCTVYRRLSKHLQRWAIREELARVLSRTRSSKGVSKLPRSVKFRRPRRTRELHANLRTNDNWKTPCGQPSESNLSHDICWNLATVKIYIFSGAHCRSTMVSSIVYRLLHVFKLPRDLLDCTLSLNTGCNTSNYSVFNYRPKTRRLFSDCRTLEKLLDREKQSGNNRGNLLLELLWILRPITWLLPFWLVVARVCVQVTRSWLVIKSFLSFYVLPEFHDLIE